MAGWGVNSRALASAAVEPRGFSAPQIAKLVPLTSEAIRNIGRRYQQGGLERALYERGRGQVQRKCSTKARNNV